VHKRDYLVKQFEEFGKVIAILMRLKKEGNFNEMSVLISESLKKYTASEIDFIENVADELLIDTLTNKIKLNDEQLKIIADLLFEQAAIYSYHSNAKQSVNCYKKSKLIYVYLKNYSTLNYSLDTHYKLEVISKIELDF
jgi:hypothetical protein